METRRAVLSMPADAALEMQAVAEVLGVSRTQLRELLDAGIIPFQSVGTRRRILLRDLREYQARRDRERRERLDGLTEVVEQAGVYDRV